MSRKLSLTLVSILELSLCLFIGRAFRITTEKLATELVSVFGTTEHYIIVMERRNSLTLVKTSVFRFMQI